MIFQAISFFSYALFGYLLFYSECPASLPIILIASIVIFAFLRYSYNQS